MGLFLLEGRQNSAHKKINKKDGVKQDKQKTECAKGKSKPPHTKQQ